MKNPKQKKFNPHSIRTKLIKRTKYSAFVTWSNLDLQEYGETARNAVYFLLTKHAKFLGVDDIKAEMTRIGY